VHLGLGRPAEAAAALRLALSAGYRNVQEQARREDPRRRPPRWWNEAFARADLSRALLALGDRSAALEQATRAVKAAPVRQPFKRGSALDAFAAAQAANGRLTDARATFRAAATMFRRDGDEAMAGASEQSMRRLLGPDA
jgi:hypothetical protein